MDVPQYAALQTRRREILARIAALTPEARASGDDKSWSPLRLIEHLNTVDAITLGNAELKPGQGSRNLLMKFLVRQMRKGKPLPAPRGLVPKGGRAYEELITESEANHSKLGDLVNRATDGDTITRHPFFGPLTATQACDLLDSHYEYHLSRFVEPKGQRG